MVKFKKGEGIGDTEATIKQQLFNLAQQHSNRADFYDRVLDISREVWAEYVQDTKDSADEEIAEGKRQGD